MKRESRVQEAREGQAVRAASLAVPGSGPRAPARCLRAAGQGRLAKPRFLGHGELGGLPTQRCPVSPTG